MSGYVYWYSATKVSMNWCRICRLRSSRLMNGEQKLHLSFFFFFNDTPTPEIYTLPLHDALPISAGLGGRAARAAAPSAAGPRAGQAAPPARAPCSRGAALVGRPLAAAFQHPCLRPPVGQIGRAHV